MTIQVFQPMIGQEEADAVRQVFESNWVGRGEKSKQFESDFADKLGVPAWSMMSITSCTEGLFLAMRMLKMGRMAEVIIPTISFIGAANAIVAAGAKPVFCDVDARTLNPTLEHIQEKYTVRTRAILLLHYAGVPCDMQPILDFAEKNGLFVVEDSACSIYSKYKDRYCGTLGHIGVWSFDAMKCLSTGDGGMMYIRGKEARETIERNAWFGLRNASGMQSKEAEWWGIDISAPASRILMNDLNAAIGIEQLKKLDGFIVARKGLHDLYCQRLGYKFMATPASIPISDDKSSSYYLFPVQFGDQETRTKLAHYLREHDVYTTFRYYPIHWVNYYKERYGEVSLPNAEKAANTTLCLPLHQALSYDDVNKVCNLIFEYFGGERSI